MEDTKLTIFLKELRRKIQKREAVRIDATRWGFLKPHEIGLGERALLAGPDIAIYQGPGGYWEFATVDNEIKVTPISEEDVRDFKRSFST